MNLEDRLRQSLQSPMPADDEEFLGAVRRGASARRRRRTTGAVAACVLAIGGVAGIAIGVRAGDDAPERPPATRTPSPTLPADAFRGASDVDVVSPEIVFRVTGNVGCIACATVWMQRNDTGWIKLHEFGAEAYDGAPDPMVQPVSDIEMAPDGNNGWAFGAKLFSTHDGGTSWTQVTAGPGRPGDQGHAVIIAGEYAWAFVRSYEGQAATLYRTPVGTDDWAEVTAPDPGGASQLVAVGDRIALVTSDEGLADSRLRTSTDGVHWGRVSLPCSADSWVYATASRAFMACPTASRFTVYRSNPDLTGWERFGTAGEEQSVLPLTDDYVLLSGGGKGELLTPSGPTPVDLGVSSETGFYTASSAGDLVYLTSYDGHAGGLFRSSDGGRTWTQIE